MIQVLYEHINQIVLLTRLKWQIICKFNVQTDNTNINETVTKYHFSVINLV